MSETTGTIAWIPVSAIHVSSSHDRQANGADAGLMASITEHGILQPLSVRPRFGDSEDAYELVFGKRRLAAARALDMATVPAVVLEMEESKARALSLVENLHREALPPLDEARAFNLLTLDIGVDGVARQAAKSPAYVHRRLQLLNLHPEARAALADGEIAIGHADRLTRVEVEMQPKALASCRSEIPERGLFGANTDREFEPAPIEFLESWIGSHAAVRTDIDADDVGAYFPELAEMEPDAVPTLLRLSESGQPGADTGDKKHGLVGAKSWVEIGSIVYSNAGRKAKAKDCDNAVDGVVVHGGPVRLARVCAKKGCPVHRPKAEPAPAGEAKATGKQARPTWEVENEKREVERKAWEAELPAVARAFAEHVKGLKLTPELLGPLVRTDDVTKHLDGWELTVETMGEAVAFECVHVCNREGFKDTAAAFGFKMPRKPKVKT